MKIGPRDTQNHEKWTLESYEIRFLRKWIFAIPPLPNHEVERNEVGWVGVHPTLRSLLPAQGEAVERPFIEIDTGDGADPSQELRTAKGQGGSATFLQSHRVQLRIPEDPLFCPTLQVRAFDFRSNWISHESRAHFS